MNETDRTWFVEECVLEVGALFCCAEEMTPGLWSVPAKVHFHVSPYALDGLERAPCGGNRITCGSWSAEMASPTLCV